MGMREEFEAAYMRDMVGNSTEPASVWLERGSDGEYRSFQARGAWWGWEASRTALVITIPEPIEMYCGTTYEGVIYADEVTDMLRESGIKTINTTTVNGSDAS